MIVSNYVAGNENDAIYSELAQENSRRLHTFIQSLINTAVRANKPFLSQTLLKAINFHAIACLHTKAGEYRPCEVHVGKIIPPPYYRVPDLMDDFINYVNRYWEQPPSIDLAAYVLWRLCYIHPFINGNGRTARAACYFVLCLGNHVSLKHTPAIPDLLDTHREEYINALRKADKLHSQKGEREIVVEPITILLEKLINESSITPKIEQVRESYQYERRSSPSLPHARGSNRAGTLAA